MDTKDKEIGLKEMAHDIKVVFKGWIKMARVILATKILPSDLVDSIEYRQMLDLYLQGLQIELEALHCETEPKQDSETAKRFEEMNSRADELNKLGKYNGIPDWHPANGNIDITQIREGIQKI